MRNFFKGKKEEKPVVIEPYRIWCNEDQDAQELKELIDSFFEKNRKETLINFEKDRISIQTNITESSKNKKKQYDYYEIWKEHTSLRIQAQQIIVHTDTNEQTITDINLYQKRDKLVDTLRDYCNTTLDDGFFLAHRTNKMEFIADTSSEEKNYVLAQLKENEKYLAYLGITNLKSELFEVSEKMNYHFAITSQRKLIIGIRGQEISIQDISSQPLQLKEKTGKDTISNERISFDTELFNDMLFAMLYPLYKDSNHSDQIEKYADIVFSKYNTKETHLNYIKKLYESVGNQTDQPKSNVKSQLLFQFSKKQCAKSLLVSEDFMEQLYEQEDFGLWLYQILSEWKIEAKEQYLFLELLVADKEHYKLKHLAVFYDAALAGIANQKKPPKEILEYRIKHLNFLKETKQYQKAIPFYEFVLEHLPDDSILELISDTNTNILDGEDCNPLRIQLLDDLSFIKTRENVSNAKELLALAQLQPLVLDRLTQLVAAGICTEKANTILSLFIEEGCMTAENSVEQNAPSTIYDKETLFKKVVPDCFKNAQSFMDSFNNLIAQVNPPDYGQVIQFSEKLDANNFPVAHTILKDLMKQLQIPSLECYIGNGDYAKGIIGVEGTPSFIILGKDHLQANTAHYFTPQELKFNLALELTHILFEHTRITSKDVWRGAKSKSMDLAGVLLVALPILSSVGNIAGKFINISKYTNLLTGVDKITNVVEKGQTAVSYGEKITDKFTSSSKESELLATSRIMEISADRVGLLVTNDLHSCIRVLLKNSDDFIDANEQIQKEGFRNYLQQQNKKGEFIHQELILRLKTLCSFYLKSQ
ncbi:hypothetical protein [Aquimarina litoralis]|uniref:hypothetical protein n=1 Tax=Aquimarina litoralis TaxID=584605 RepID=UPI001C5840BB|nr:hypothetical protein [Aquimarina litoralis]MBW1297853.1 hypothetical protein [Aquimarina litoralis]